MTSHHGNAVFKRVLDLSSLHVNTTLVPNLTLLFIFFLYFFLSFLLIYLLIVFFLLLFIFNFSVTFSTWFYSLTLIMLSWFFPDSLSYPLFISCLHIVLTPMPNLQKNQFLLKFNSTLKTHMFTNFLLK